MGGVDFKQFYINLERRPAYESLELAEKAGAPLIKYGAFINSMVDFTIIAFAIFVAVKAINKLKREEQAAPCCARRRRRKISFFCAKFVMP
jgi:large conductance mechanosensitive channel